MRRKMKNGGRDKKRAKAGGKFLIVVSRFNSWITERLLAGAIRELSKRGIGEKMAEVVWVPGSFELPQAGKIGAQSGRYRGVICLGAVIKGETSHDRHIAGSCALGIQAAAGETGVPFSFGVITANSAEQAMARCRLDGGRNMGSEAASAAIEMAGLFEGMGKD